jgi:hypothetical protein
MSTSFSGTCWRRSADAARERQWQFTRNALIVELTGDGLASSRRR